VRNGSLQELADPRLFFPDLAASTRDAALLEMARRLAGAGVITDPVELASRLSQRERDGCTGLGSGIAIPHCRVKGLPSVVLSVGISAAGIDFGAADGVPVTILFLLLSPMDAPGEHLTALARLSRMVRTPALLDELRHAESAEAIRRVLREAEPAAAATA
jgi:mannitol/fructose-specific phosphotransferase system IIA component (Ntr-type)